MSIPSSIEGLLDFSLDCSCGRTHTVEMQRAAIGHGALEKLDSIVKPMIRTTKVGLIDDGNTHKIAGQKVEALLEQGGFEVTHYLVPDGVGGRPHADFKTVEKVGSALEGMDLAVSVGSGTINDLTKLASFNVGIPYVTVATAPSMNGYTSAIAAIMKDGVKRTVSCHQPLAVIADLDILSDAPMEMIAAGLGDLESKPTSTADFKMGQLVRGDYFCLLPVEVVIDAEKRASEEAAGLRRRDSKSIEVLTEALILSGLSMKLAGTSSPASGGEHLISHYWDMTAESEGREEGWHGAQVGVTTIAMAALYEQLRELDPAKIDPASIVKKRASIELMKERIDQHYGSYAKEVFAEYSSKHLGDAALSKRLEHIKDNWESIWKELDLFLRPSQNIVQILKNAGAPVTVKELGLSKEHFARGYLRAREIRGRYTVLDFAADLGVLEELYPKVAKLSGILGES